MGGMRAEDALNLAKAYTKKTVQGMGAIQGEKGEPGADGQDGVSPVANVTKANGVVTISITDATGTTTEEIHDGVNGENGSDGADGISPTVAENENNTDDVYKLDITDKEKTITTPNLIGKQGEKGSDGIDGKNCTIKSIEEATNDEGISGHNVTFAWMEEDGTEKTETMFVADGKQGGNMTQTIDANSTDEEIPSAKAVYDKVSGMHVELTQAEYDALSDEKKNNGTIYYITDADASGIDIVTTLDSTVTDNQVPSAKSVYDNYPVKTYVNLAQLGLTSGCSTGDIYNALPSRSIFMLNVINASVMVSDVPETDGILIIHKHDNSRVDIMFKKSQASAVSENTMYLGSLKGSDGTGITWERVCTTTVADVALTQLTVNSWCSHGSARYTVRNGVCYVDIDSLVSSTMSTSSQVIISGLPIPLIQSWHSLGANSNAISTPVQNLLVSIKANGDLVNHIGTDNAEYYGTFSYPVAE